MWWRRPLLIPRHKPSCRAPETLRWLRTCALQSGTCSSRQQSTTCEAHRSSFKTALTYLFCLSFLFPSSSFLFQRHNHTQYSCANPLVARDWPHGRGLWPATVPVQCPQGCTGPAVGNRQQTRGTNGADGQLGASSRRYRHRHGAWRAQAGGVNELCLRFWMSYVYRVSSLFCLLLGPTPFVVHSGGFFAIWLKLCGLQRVVVLMILRLALV